MHLTSKNIQLLWNRYYNSWETILCMFRGIMLTTCFSVFSGRLACNICQNHNIKNPRYSKLSSNPRKHHTLGTDLLFG